MADERLVWESRPLSNEWGFLQFGLLYPTERDGLGRTTPGHAVHPKLSPNGALRVKCLDRLPSGMTRPKQKRAESVPSALSVRSNDQAWYPCQLSLRSLRP